MSDIPFKYRFRVTEEEAYDAFNLVEMELWRLGVLWRGSKLDKTRLRYRADRFGNTRNSIGDIWKTLGKNSRDLAEEGHWLNGVITIPQYGFWLGRQASIEDVIRHEFGHALADLYPRALSKGGLFREAFGAKYGPDPAPEIDPDNWEFDCVSKYAATKTQEDFAETFMLFVKHKGKMPRKFAGKPAIKKKWAAVAEIVKRVAAAAK